MFWAEGISRRLVAVAAAAVVVAGGGLLSVAPAASATPLSAGCTLLNGDGLDGNFGETVLSAAAFAAGERVTMTAGDPSTLSPTGVRLQVPDGVTVSTSSFPGSVSYTFPADVTTTMSWLPVGGFATFAVSCEFVGLPAQVVGVTAASIPIPDWLQAYGRSGAHASCPTGWNASWARWPHGGTGGFVCERSIPSYG